MSEATEKNNDKNKVEGLELTRAVQELGACASMGKKPLKINKNVITGIMLSGLGIFFAMLFYFSEVKTIIYLPYEADGRVEVPALGLSVVPPQGFQLVKGNAKGVFRRNDGAWIRLRARRLTSLRTHRTITARSFTCVFYAEDLQQEFKGEAEDTVPVELDGRSGGLVVINSETETLVCFGVIREQELGEIIVGTKTNSEVLSGEEQFRLFGSLKFSKKVVKVVAAKTVKKKVKSKSDTLGN